MAWAKCRPAAYHRASMEFKQVVLTAWKRRWVVLWVLVTVALTFVVPRLQRPSTRV